MLFSRRSLSDRLQQRGSTQRAAIPLSLALTAIGLFTMSWDRLLVIDALGFNLKPPTLAFIFAVVATAGSSLGRYDLRIPPPARRAANSAVLLFLVVFA